MPKPSEHQDPKRDLDPSEAERLSATMRAIGSPNRLRMLWALLDGERSVEQLVDSIGLEQSATSHHLRKLRESGLVSTRRDGRSVFYSLHDHHVPELLAAIRHHQEHVNDQSSSPT